MKPKNATPLSASDNPQRPQILAPAGNQDAFLAALAAGADAIYCGLKQHSARMAAQNFTIEELAPLVSLAHQSGVRVMITFNTMLQPADLARITYLLQRLHRTVSPDGVIVQDLALPGLLRKIGYKGEIHLSTLANMSVGRALTWVGKALGVDGVVLPRELNVDEIKQMAAQCPPNLNLEVFVHGALCYAVSGRCYWSSYLGGKSGLRGRCVQPCRRQYRQQSEPQRSFACHDLSLDVLVKVLKTIPQIKTWKIEGRKKGPHYVYYAVQAYRLLRDPQPSWSQAKRTALALLEMALGRPGSHYNFLPQRPQLPLEGDHQTASGLLVGHVRGQSAQSILRPRIALLPEDLLRIGYQDQPGHRLLRLRRPLPRNGRFVIQREKNRKPPVKGMPIFLIDRREPALMKQIERLARQLPPAPALDSGGKSPAHRRPQSSSTSIKSKRPLEMAVYRDPRQRHGNAPSGRWVSPAKPPAPRIQNASKTWWWLPPTNWPDSEKTLEQHVQRLLQSGASRFVLNSPWQVCLFPTRQRLTLWAGPFCNLANPRAIDQIAKWGFAGAIVSPELGQEAYLQLPQQTRLPLGVVTYAHWPLCVSRISPANIDTEQAIISPMQEAFFVESIDADYWLFPNWPLDLRKHQHQLTSAGYQMMVEMIEPIPKNIRIKQRPGEWNWGMGLP